jgi:hypothetical protein
MLSRGERHWVDAYLSHPALPHRSYWIAGYRNDDFGGQRAVEVVYDEFGSCRAYLWLGPGGLRDRLLVELIAKLAPATGGAQ